MMHVADFLSFFIMHTCPSPCFSPFDTIVYTGDFTIVLFNEMAETTNG